MGWVRRRARGLSLWALFALALQLGLSFGHIHHDEAPFALATAAAPSDAPAPDTDPGHDDHCAICLAATMAGSALAAAAPHLPPPPAFARLHASLPDALDTANPRRAAFRSRAPPLS
jgi:hypothetical protein